MIQNKHIIRLSFIGLFLNIMVNIALYRYSMIEEVVIKQTLAQNTRIVEIYKNKIWSSNKNVVSKLNKQSLSLILDDKDFTQFLVDSSSFFSRIKDEVSLYNKCGKRFFKSKYNNFLEVKFNNSNQFYNRLILNIDKYFLSTYVFNNSAAKAVMGKASHSITLKVNTPDKGYKEENESSFIESYIPIISFQNGNHTVEGIVKITNDNVNNIIMSFVYHIQCLS